MATKSNMTWKYEGLVQEHQLVDGNSIVARIFLNPTRKGKFRVTTLISMIYFGEKQQQYLEKRKRQWLAYRKKFTDKTKANQYIERKKAIVLRFVQLREAGL